MSLHVIRESDIWGDAMTAIAPKVGRLVEFYRSPARKLWTPTGVNVPEYPQMAQVWWQNVSKAISGEQTPQQAMDGLARDRTRSWSVWRSRAFRASLRPQDERRTRLPSTGTRRPTRTATSLRSASSRTRSRRASPSTTTNSSRPGRPKSRKKAEV